MPVPKTGAFPLGDSPIPVSGPAARSENRRRSAQRRDVFGPRERGARADAPRAFGPPEVSCGAPRFQLAFKDSVDARPAPGERRTNGAGARKRVPRTPDFGVEPHHDGLEIVRHHTTE